MPKQMIPVDVPEGMEIDWDLVKENNSESPLTIYVVYFKKKEPEKFIEIRSYWMSKHPGMLTPYSVTRESYEFFGSPELHKHFHSWIDKEWRKVEI